MSDTNNKNQDSSKESIIFTTNKQKITNKKIYFDVDGTEIKIGYDDQTGVGFVEIVSE